MHLPKGLYKRGKSYYLDYKDEAGKRIRRSVGPDLHRALDLLKGVRGPLRQSQTTAGMMAVLGSYIDRQRIYSKRRSLKAAESSAKRLLLHFGDLPISELGTNHVDSFIVARRRHQVANKTVNNDLIVLRAALNHAVSSGVLQSCPVKVKLLKTRRRAISQILTSQQIRRILDCANGRIYGILLIASQTGFRTDEILHLQWKDVGFDNGSISVTTKGTIWSSKNHQERCVFVSRSVIDWLCNYREHAPGGLGSDWIFSTRNATPMSVHNVCRLVRQVFEAAGVYVKGQPTIHLIRHTVASTLLSNGADLETVRDWLGHADISTTAVYLHSTDRRKRDAAEKLKILIA